MKKLFLAILMMIFFSFNSNLLNAQWVQTKGPEGGGAQCFTSIDTILFVGTYCGVFRSTDNGDSWTPTGQRSQNFVSLAVRSSGDTVMNLFAGTYGAGVYLSTDNGDSWQQVNSELGNRFVNSLAVCDMNLFAGTEDGVFLSPGNGDSWIPASSGLTNMSVKFLTVFDKNLYAGTESGLFISTDNGTTWTPFGLAGKRVNAFAAIGSNFFAGTDTSGVFISKDNGANWEIISTPDMDRDVRALAVINDTLFVATGWMIYRTPANDINWIPAYNGVTNMAYALYVRGTDLFLGTQRGVFRTTNYGEEWTAVNTGIIGTDVRCLLSSGTNLYAGIWGGIFRSSDTGNSWTPLATGGACLSLDMSGSYLYAGGVGHVGCSTDNGDSWEWCPVAPGFMTALAVSGTNLFAGLEGSGVFRINHNATGPWILTPTNLTDSLVYALVVKDTFIFVGTEGGVFRSTNNGMDWMAVNNGLTNLKVRALAVSDSNLFAGTSGGGAFLSTNNGTDWTPVNNGLTDQGMAVLSFVFSGRNLFAGTWQGGVYLSTDNGASWNPVNTGLMSVDTHPASVVHGLAIAGDDLFAGTRGAGVWRRPLSDMITSVERISSELPGTFSLEQNYPNPFNPTTTIEFTLPNSEFTTLKIYNILGKEVSTLVSNKLNQGSHTYQFDGKNLASGIYYYQLVAGSYREVKKMILLR